MHSKEAVYNHLVKVLVELFEIEAKEVRLEALLYEDLDIDSIDAVDIVLHMEEFTGEKIQPPEFKDIRTVQNLVDTVYNLLSSDTAEGAA